MHKSVGGDAESGDLAEIVYRSALCITAEAAEILVSGAWRVSISLDDLTRPRVNSDLAPVIDAFFALKESDLRRGWRQSVTAPFAGKNECAAVQPFPIGIEYHVVASYLA